MTDARDELPNLWVEKGEMLPCRHHVGTINKMLPEDNLYIPADRISSFIADLRSTGISLQQRAILDDLESLLSEGEAR